MVGNLRLDVDEPPCIVLRYLSESFHACLIMLDEVDPSTRGGYPKGPIHKPGRVAELLSKYDNLYGDLSAGSGYNAIRAYPESVICKFFGSNPCVARLRR